jgi:hypothetical protein
MKAIDAARSPSRRLDDDSLPGARPAIAARPILRRAAPAPTPAPASARARTADPTISEALRRAIHAHAQTDAGAPSSPRDPGVAGLFGQALNAGIHDLPAAVTGPLAGLGGSLGGIANDPLGALRGIAGSVLGGAGSALGALTSNPLGALQGLFGSALSIGSLGDLASNPLAALGGMATNALGGATGALAGQAGNSLGALAGVAGNAIGGTGGASVGLPPQLTSLRTSLSPALQSELDQLAATPEGLAALQAELHSGTGGARPPSAATTGSAAAPAGAVARHGAGEVSDTAAESLGHASASPGVALPSDLRERFEATLHTDLSGVRIHTDGSAAAAAAAFGAHAFAHGQDVYFAAGQYRPGSAAGDHLIAHEVAHTVQQRVAAAAPQYQLEVSEPGDAHEHDADRAADAMVAGISGTHL